MEAVVALCWNEPLQEVLHERYEGAFVEVISHLDQLARCLPTRQAWDELVFLPPPTKPCMPHQSGHLGYIMGHVVDLGWMLRSLQFCISQQDGEFVCMAQGLLFEGSMLANDPATNRAEWISMRSLPATCHWQRRPLHEN